ncbi:MAG: hypothetical protein KY466_05645 [Gemmatimonadetes bacterium]|nr:hypothetical protein [Gemmatimonadota bacterium]
MEDVTRKRIMRQLEALPDAQLYQVMDYIEFVMAKYAAAASHQPDAFQRFAERVEDQMRVRSLAPKAMKGTMKIMSTAGKVLDGVRDLGRDLATSPPARGASTEGPAGGELVPDAEAAPPPRAMPAPPAPNGGSAAAGDGAERTDEDRA